MQRIIEKLIDYAEKGEGRIFMMKGLASIEEDDR
jgi:hypothetical protein